MATVSLTESGVFAALASVLAAWLPGLELIKAQQNRTPEPETPDFAVFLPVTRERQSTNIASFFDGFPSGQPGTRTDLQPTRFTIQVDVHGPASADNAQTVATLWRSDAGADAFAATGADIQPLYCSEPRQLAFVDGEQQVESRWMLDLVLQANIAVTTPQDFAATVTATAATVASVI